MLKNSGQTDRIHVLKNEVQTYAWGSPGAIPSLQGRAPKPGVPEAELWMGAHPKAPSMVQVDEHWISLEKLIAEYPSEVLGKRTADAFGGKLPYLFKVLAAAAPLSLQAHPNPAQARRGFKRENDMGISFDAPHRNYKDANHKPECICALTPFWAMCGFRKVPEILTLAAEIRVAGFDRLLQNLHNRPNPQGLKVFFQKLMTQSPETRTQLTREAVAGARCCADKNPVFRWMLSLAEAYPGDIGIYAPIILNLVQLQPGEAMCLPAGELHAYLEGVGIELMANSDNVLRGGLTPKHVDVEELMRVLNFKEREVRIVSPQPDRNGEALYACDVKEFELSTVSVNRHSIYRSDIHRSIEIILCTSGRATITDRGHKENIALDKGTSVVVPAALDSYTITGEALLYKAAVPL